MADQIDPTAVSPEEFAGLVKNATDEQIEEVIHAVGTRPTLDRIFDGFQERFNPDKAQGVEAEVQFTVKDGGEEFPHVVAVKDQTCQTRSGASDNPKTTITTDLISFVKLVTGNAQGVQLFMTGKLKVSGDLMFSQRVMTLFDPPKAP
ncbi:MAG: SCP2 sterol-binding domain-containing protein [Actinomycetota bacterium]